MINAPSSILAIVLGFLVLGLAPSTLATSFPERESLTANHAQAKRQRVKKRQQQLGQLKTYAKPHDSGLRSHLSRAPSSLRARIAHIERTWGPVKLVSVCRPGATFVQGGKRFPSWHGSCRAIDFEPPAKHRAAVLAYVRKTTPGYVLTYGWSKHVHIDNAREGRFAKKQAPAKAWPRVAVSQKGTVEALIPTEAMPVAYEPSRKPLEAITTADKYGIFALDEAREYLVRTASLGGTMTRQGPTVAIGRLHPEFTIRLSNAVKQARQKGLTKAGVFSAYRPPAFGVGGFNDKFRSLHAYGLAVDLSGIGRPGSAESRLWNRIALQHKIYNPYGFKHRAEWNHYQPTWTKGVAGNEPLRKLITASGPIDLPRMWRVADAMLDRGARQAISVGKRKVRWAKSWSKKRWAALKKKWRSKKGRA